MPVPVQRVIKVEETRNSGVLQTEFEMTGLTRIQTDSYARFLQADVDPSRRKAVGLEELLRVEVNMVDDGRETDIFFIHE